MQPDSIAECSYVVYQRNMLKFVSPNVPTKISENQAQTEVAEGAILSMVPASA